jgi:sterol desaturase/sphingolipid hydroxylase (fatty acid hydroxylase superfamily)
MTQGSREELRSELLSRVPARYSPLLHVALPALAGVVLVVFALGRIEHLRPWELALVPVFFLVGNAVEWHAHRGLLHRRTRFLEVLYVRHTPQHHHLYVAEDLAIRSLRELRFVLLPGYALLLIVAVASPVALVALAFGEVNVAALWLASAVTYVLAYEWLHLAWHLPPESSIGRLGFVRAMRRHHQLHHAPHLMNRRNFNVTVPAWDLVRGTYYRGEPAPGDVALARRPR